MGTHNKEAFNKHLKAINRLNVINQQIAIVMTQLRTIRKLKCALAKDKVKLGDRYEGLLKTLNDSINTLKRTLLDLGAQRTVEKAKIYSFENAVAEDD